jgi:peptidoglycan hydrolase CwlO-like protein
MSEANDITVLNIDEVPYEVASLSEEAQNLVKIYNNWGRKENEAMGEVAMIQAAKQTLSAQIVAKVREEAAAKEAAEEVDVPAPNVTTDEAPAATEPAE